MLDCWKKSPADRPAFDQLARTFKGLTEGEFENVEVSRQGENECVSFCTKQVQPIVLSQPGNQ